MKAKVNSSFTDDSGPLARFTEYALLVRPLPAPTAGVVLNAADSKVFASVFERGAFAVVSQSWNVTKSPEEKTGWPVVSENDIDIAFSGWLVAPADSDTGAPLETAATPDTLNAIACGTSATRAPAVRTIATTTERPVRRLEVFI